MDSHTNLGFNSELLDSTLNNYHLGNGYRAYNPSIMQFTAPDDRSPFGHGGINPYVYCSGDPINNSDPTGHFLGFAGVLLSMLMPINLPHGTGIGAIIESVEENAVNTGINEGIDAVIELVSAGTATPAIPALNVMIAPVEHLAERPVERDVRRQVEHLSLSRGIPDRPIIPDAEPSRPPTYSVSEEIGPLRGSIGGDAPPSYSKNLPELGPTFDHLRHKRPFIDTHGEAVVRGVRDIYKKLPDENARLFSGISKVEITHERRRAKAFTVFDLFYSFTKEQVKYLQDERLLLKSEETMPEDFPGNFEHTIFYKYIKER